MQVLPDTALNIKTDPIKKPPFFRAVQKANKKATRGWPFFKKHIWDVYRRCFFAGK